MRLFTVAKQHLAPAVVNIKNSGLMGLFMKIMKSGASLTHPITFHFQHIYKNKYEIYFTSLTSYYMSMIDI